MLVDYDILDKEINIDGVIFKVSTLSVENYNRFATLKLLSEEKVNPNEWLAVVKQIINDHVIEIKNAQVKEKGVVRDATKEDLTKHSGFYGIVMNLVGRMFETASLTEEEEKN